MATKSEIRDKVALKLGIKAIGQALSNAYANDLDDAYDENHEMLQRLDLADWSATAEVPEEFVFQVVALIAVSRVTEYGVTGERLVGITSAANSAKARIRELIKDPYFDSAEGAQYY